MKDHSCITSSPPAKHTMPSIAHHRPPTVDIQDFSVPTEATEVPGEDADEVLEFSTLSRRNSPASIDMMVTEESKPRKLSRGSSIKSLFGGSKAPKTTPMTLSPNGTPSKSSRASPSGQKQFLQVGNTSSIFRLPKPQVKLLRKTSSVKQLYNSVLHALKTIASSRDDIVPELTKTFFENILRASDDSPKLVVTKVTVKDEQEFGRHFCAEVHAVEVFAKINNEDIKYHLIVKSQPQNEDARKFLQPSHTFEKEVQMYGQVFHDMANFVRRASVISLNCKDSEVIDIPRCYYTRWAGDDDNMKEDLIILENLYPKGFSFAVNQDDGLDRRHSELVIRELAKFHAISYCMKQGQNDFILEQYPYLAEDSLYRESTEGFTKRTITPVMASLAELLRNTPEYEEHYEWFVDLARNFHGIQMEMVRPKNRFAVICHGDLWLSKILFKYINVSDSPCDTLPAEVKFIDFQSSRFASLATDLVLFLFTCVKTELRRTMLGELISLYYTTFLVSVRSLNMSDELFSMEELFIEIEENIIYGFLEGIWYLDILHSGNVPKTGSSNDDEGDDDDDDDLGPHSDLDDGRQRYLDLLDDGTRNEDEHEAAQLKRWEKKLLQTETKEQRDYKEEFFELLNEVLFLQGKSSTVSAEDRKSLRDTSNRFQGRNSFSSAVTPSSDGGGGSANTKNSLSPTASLAN